MQRKDLYLVGILWLILLLIFLPLFYSNYIFMDEAFQLWGYRAIPGFYMFIDEGRFLTEELQRWLFNKIDTIHDVMYLRWFSLFGWMLCLPIWFAIIKREVKNAPPQYKFIPFFTCLYLITNPSFLVSVQWATCLQFFISDTMSILAGAIVINTLRSDEFKLGKFSLATGLAVLLGVFAMFLYQGSWACFLIPFFLYFINPMNLNKNKVMIWGGIAFFAGYFAYFVIYKASFHFMPIPEDPRNKLYINPFIKLAFFLARPLERSFRFTVLTSERSVISLVYYGMALLALTWLTFKRFGKGKAKQAVIHLCIVMAFGLLSYLPGLLIEENYASNRTQFALNLIVFILCFEMALYYIKNKLVLEIGAGAMVVIFVFCARYNFDQGFARPLVAETAALKNYFRDHYNKNITTVHWIRPSEDELAKKFHINFSMDEFGVPNSFFVWVPENLSKQLVYEITGDRQTALNLKIGQWGNKEEYLKAGGGQTDSTVLVVDTKEIIESIKP